MMKMIISRIKGKSCIGCFLDDEKEEELSVMSFWFFGFGSNHHSPHHHIFPLR